MSTLFCQIFNTLGVEIFAGRETFANFGQIRAKVKNAKKTLLIDSRKKIIIIIKVIKVIAVLYYRVKISSGKSGEIFFK